MSQETNLLKKCGLCPKGPEERIGIQETIFYDDPSDELKVTGIEYACGLGKELGAGCDLPEAYAMIAGIFKKARTPNRTLYGSGLSGKP